MSSYLFFLLILPCAGLKCYFCTEKENISTQNPCFEPDDRTTVVDGCNYCIESATTNSSRFQITRACGRNKLPKKECQDVKSKGSFRACYCTTDLCTTDSVNSNVTTKTESNNATVKKSPQMAAQERGAYEWSFVAITVFTLLLQAYIIFLIIKKTPASMSEYRFFFLLFIVWDFIFTLLFGLFFLPKPLAPNVAAVSKGISSMFGCDWCVITACVVFYAGTNLMVSQYYCLIYRYTVTQPGSRLHRTFMLPSVKFASMIVSQILSISNAISAYKTIVDPSEFLYNKISLPKLENSKDCVVYMDNFKAYTIVFLIGILCSFICGEFISIYFVMTTLRKLRKRVHTYSIDAQRLHIQFTVVLGMRLLTSALFIVLPICTAIVCIFLAIPATNTSAMIGLFWMNLHGPTNGFFTVFSVQPYKEFTRDKFCVPIARPLGIQLDTAVEPLPRTRGSMNGTMDDRTTPESFDIHIPHRRESDLFTMKI